MLETGVDASLVAEDLVEKLAFNLRQLLKGSFHGATIFKGCLADVAVEPQRGVVHQHLRVHQAFRITRKTEVDEFCIVLDLMEGRGGAVAIAREHLMAGQLGELVDEFRVKEALFARLGLEGLGLHLRECAGVRNSFVGGRGTTGDGEEEGNSGEDATSRKAAHNAPLMLRRRSVLVHVLKGDEAVTGLPLLIWKFSGCHG
jgi:hypothetical protein